MRSLSIFWCVLRWEGMSFVNQFFVYQKKYVLKTLQLKLPNKRSRNVLSAIRKVSCLLAVLPPDLELPYLCWLGSSSPASPALQWQSGVSPLEPRWILLECPHPSLMRGIPLSQSREQRNKTLPLVYLNNLKCSFPLSVVIYLCFLASLEVQMCSSFPVREVLNCCGVFLCVFVYGMQDLPFHTVDKIK